MAVGNDYVLFLNDTTDLIRPGITSATIKSYLTAASSYQTFRFGWGEYNLTDWASAQVITVPTVLRGTGSTILTGLNTVPMLQIRAPILFYGITFKNWGIVTEFTNITGSKLDWVRFVDCEFLDCIRPIYTQDTFSGSETVGVKRLDIHNCRFTAASLTLDDPGLGPRTTDGEPCIEWFAPADAVSITECEAENIKKSFCRFGFTGDDAEAANWKKFRASGNAIKTVRAGQNGSTNNASGINWFGVDAVIDGNQIEDVQCADADEQTGLFCFCETSVIANNRLHNCGGRDGAISIKSDTRAGGTTNPPGYRIQIVDNSITFTDAYTAAQAAPQRGIWCQQEDVLIAGNIIDRCTHHGIHLVGTVNGKKTVVRDNIVTNCRMNDTSDAVLHCNCGDDLLVEGNVFECTPQGVIAGRVVRVQPDGTGARVNWVFRGNTLKNSGGGSGSYGFVVVASSDVAILEFSGNTIRGVRDGIRFDTGTISDTIIKDNTFASDVTNPIVLTAVPTRYRIYDNPGRSPVGITFTADDADPSVLSYDGGLYYATAYTQNTPIGRFDGLQNENGNGIADGTVIHIMMGNNTFFRPQHNTSIRTKTGAAITSGQENRVLSFMRVGGTSAPMWVQVGASEGSAATA